MNLTPLECAVLEVCYKEYGGDGFPTPDEIVVVDRENTGAGRFTTISSHAQVASESPVSPNILIEMEGLTYGIGVLVFLNEEGNPDLLEMLVYGDDSWNGDERPWRIRPQLEVPNA